MSHRVYTYCVIMTGFDPKYFKFAKNNTTTNKIILSYLQQCQACMAVDNQNKSAL